METDTFYDAFESLVEASIKIAEFPDSEVADDPALREYRDQCRKALVQYVRSVSDKPDMIERELDLCNKIRKAITKWK